MVFHQKLAFTALVFYVSCLCFLYMSNAYSDYEEYGDVDRRPYVLPVRKVNLSLYYGALCPYCASFIVRNLSKIFETDLISIVNLRLVPWGDTELTARNSWICQNGVEECELNVLEACAIHEWPDVETHFKFIACVENLALVGKKTKWAECFQSLDLYPDNVTICHKSTVGIDLDLKYADETASLNPPHKFLPWVLVNNNPLGVDYHNYEKYVCKAYTGFAPPAICKALAPEM